MTKRSIGSEALCACLAAILALVGPARGQVSGIARDAATLLPLSGARIAVQTTTIITTTAPDGSYSLPDAVGSDLIITGAKKGYYTVSDTVTSPAQGIEILIPAVPQGNNPNYQFVTATTCGLCHPDQEDQWVGSEMAMAGQNRWVYDLYNGTGTAGGMGGFVYTRDSVHAANNPNSECASCHQPESWVKQPFCALEDINHLSQNAIHGVSCDLCHKIADVDESKPNYPGIYPGVVTVTRPDDGLPTQVEYGVLGDSDYTEEYIMRGSYQPQMTAAMCGTCHQDKNDPDEDGDFEEENGIVSEPTYLEWRNGPYGDPESPLYITCITCHMPSFGDSLACETIMAPNPPIRDPETIRSHDVEGSGATFVEKALDVQVSGAMAGNTIDAEVRITNVGAGHFVPTGVAIRNVILLVTAWRLEDGLVLDPTGEQTVHPLGGVGDPAQGYYAGLPGKLYARVFGDADGQWPAFYTEATSVLFDNRIPPLESDTTRYSFEVPPGGGTFAVNARVIYRRAFRSLIDAKGWTQDGHGGELEDLLPPHFGHLMKEAGWMSESAAVDPGSDRTAMGLAQSTPNPATGRVRIDFDLAASGPVRLAIYDIAGRHIVTLVDGEMIAGRQSVAWPGKDQAGTPLPSGVYVYVFEAAGLPPSQRRLVLLR